MLLELLQEHYSLLIQGDKMAFNSGYYDRASRYLRNLKVLFYNDGTQAPTTFDKVKFISDDIESYYTVPPNENNRLDIISYKLYGKVDYWWVLAAANNMETPQDSPAPGEAIAVPSLRAIERYI